ncbi:ICMT-domain-containing protein [Trametes cingulata]|nr:ICMT-domain-containing protein [Trametes cingulata]
MLLKALLTASCGIFFGAAVTPPQPAAKGAVKVYKGQPLEHIIRSFSYFVRAVLFCAFLAFGVAIAAGSNPGLQPLLPYVCPAGLDSAKSLAEQSSPRFVLGTILVVFGATLRLWSFRVLGPLFTFEVVITKDHHIIKSGPYAYVRHPAYLGMIALTIGVHLMQFGANGYVTVCDIVHSPAAVFVYLWWVGAPFVILSVYRRCFVEDAQLEEHFGDGWHAYRREVPYRLLPPIH